MAIVHISEADAAKDFAQLMSHVRCGEEVVIESDARPLAVIRAVEPRLGRPLSDLLALAEARERVLGSAPIMDCDFLTDM